MDKMTIILVVIALLIVGAVIIITLKAKADKEKARQSQINALINYKNTQAENKATTKDWLSTITNVSKAVASAL